MISGVFEFVLLFGAVISFMISGTLWFYVHNFFANRVLAVLTFIWGLISLVFVIQSKEFYLRFPHLFGVFSGLILLLFPLIYFYVRTYLYSNARKFSQLVPHLIPFAIYLLVITPLISMPISEKRDIINNGFPDWLTVVFGVNDIVISTQGVIYSALSLRLLQKVKYFRIKQLSGDQIKALNWLVFFVLSNIFYWVIGTSGAILELFNPNLQFDLFKVFYFGITYLNVLLGVYTIYKPKLFSFDESLRGLVYDGDINELNEPQDDESNKNKEDLGKIEDYIKSEKLYLQKKIDMQKLLYTTGVSKRRLYEVLDTELDMSLTDLLNRYRTDEMIHMLDSNMQQEYTLTHLAEMAGFQSKATFNRVFKKYTGKTPSQFIGHQN